MNAPKEISDRHVILAMKRYGGHFVMALGQAAQHADTENLAKLKQAFPQIWECYAEMAKTDLIEFVAAELHKANFQDNPKLPFQHCNVCGCVLRGDSELAMGMCTAHANEGVAP
jgi:hypothetical protein